MKIALMGYARSGKDTVFEMIRKQLNARGRYVYRLAFGDEMREYFHSIFDTPINPKPRKEYEIFANSCRRVDENVWVKQLAKTEAEMEWGVDDFVITDLRQMNEYMWATENGYTVIRVTSSPELRKERSQGDASFNEVNQSEEGLVFIPYEYVIENTGTLEDLEIEVKKLLKTLEDRET